MWALELDQKRIPDDQAVTLTWTTYSAGTATDPGTLTIGIVDGNGAEVVAAGSAVTDNSDGTFSYSLASVSDPTVLVATFTVAGVFTITKHLEVVGTWLFQEAEARSHGVKANSTNKPLSSATEYPDPILQAEKWRVLDDMEEWTHRSWVARYARVEYQGTGTRTLYAGDGACRLSNGDYLNRPGRWTDISSLLSVTVGGTAVSTSNVTVDPLTGCFTFESGAWTAATATDPYNITIEYVYGLPVPVDGADRIAMDLLIDRLVPSAIPDRATSWDTDFGTVRVVTEGGPMQNKTRLPHVNQWLNQHVRRSF